MGVEYRFHSARNVNGDDMMRLTKWLFRTSKNDVLGQHVKFSMDTLKANPEMILREYDRLIEEKNREIRKIITPELLNAEGVIDSFRKGFEQVYGIVTPWEKISYHERGLRALRYKEMTTLAEELLQKVEPERVRAERRRHEETKETLESIKQEKEWVKKLLK